ncbi:MAG: AEC family transporter [Devosiaceae bacterium]|nr:AEC family transporter [Devosiaceae bacterium]
MVIVFSSLLPIFALIALGFILRKSNFVPSEQWRGVEMISFWLLFPALLITTLAHADMAFGELTSFGMALFAMVVIVSFLVWLLRRPLHDIWHVRGPAFTTIFQTSTRWHGFIALAVIEKLYGTSGLAILAIAFVFMVPFLNVINILILAIYAGKTKPTFALISGALLRNPLLWGIAIGILINVLDIKLPDPLFVTLDLLGRAALGVSLLALGAGLSWKAMKTSGKEVVFSSMVKLLFTPVLAAGLALVFNVTGVQFIIMIIAASVPTAVNGYVLARAMGGDTELYAATSTAQVLISFITMPIIIYIAMNFAQ